MISLTKIPSHIKNFQRWMEGRGYRRRSTECYAKTIKDFLTANPFGDEYKYTDIIAHFEKLSESGLTIGTRKYILIHLKRYYDYLVYTRQRKDHPCGGLYLKGCRDRGVIQSDLFTMVELEQLLKKASEYGKQPLRNKLVISLMIYQAMATEEICRLKIGDINMDKGIIHIKGSCKRNSRELTLNETQYDILQEYMKKERLSIGDNEPLLLNQYGQAISQRSVSDILLPFKEMLAGRELKPLMIRRSVVSHWLNVLKLPEEDVQLLAGMRWVSSVERYQHITGSEEQEIMKKFHPMG